MKFAIISVAVLLVNLASAALEPIRRATNSTPEGRILLGSPGHIYIVKWVPGIDVGFRILLDEKVPAVASWMAFAPPNHLYVVDESSTALYLYELDLNNNKLVPVEVQEASSGVVHLEFNADKTRLLGSAYGNGTIDIWNVENGGLSLIKTITTPNKGPQVISHPHQANLDPTGRFFAINDLGTDSIIIVDSKSDAYEIIDIIYIMPEGCGPRHGVFYPRGAYMATSYMVVCEKSNRVLVYSVKYESDTLALKQIQQESTFTNDSPPANESAAAAGSIVLMPDNQSLYVTNRLTGNETDYITSFKIDSLNYSVPRLIPSHTFSTHGLVPRMISPSNEGKYIFAANQGGRVGLIAMERMMDGSLSDRPMIGLWGDMFGEEDSGPRFVQQIR
ncbi:hypothetical protein FALBO_3017 [Fusarium albosuccineum]|uniref:6-phosphogluconolactonase n=1 Tax=Fusarium albosuccineum TaxID=1237068 RepID=A0A8H4PL99_9HYPO|nr:hypothetical protein FALBO_3017 [Fusarium albosuccineum]